jgi:TonB family protein
MGDGDQRLGRFTVLKHLASGGMADVLLARTDGIEGFARHVVVKRIRAEHAKDQRFIEMFLDEARVAAGLHHQNIVQVHDIGQANGEYFFTMEYLHGEDLRKVLSKVSKTGAHMPLGYVISIITSIATGLHYAHERLSSDGEPLGIVHRDVSPSNILIGYDGAVKIVDFGIAKAAMRQTETKTGSFKGKVSYMSPEQCKGDPVDGRSDVYSLGVLLYEVTTTRRLFKNESEYVIMDAIVNGKVPSPRSRRPDLPEQLSQIIMKALAVDVEQRYQSAEELRIALDRFATGAGLMTSSSALATYMTQLFGKRPEPWLDTDALPNLDATSAERPRLRQISAMLPREEVLPRAPEPEASQSFERALPVEPARIGEIAPKETRTSTNFGFERQSQVVRPPAPARSRGALVGVLVAIPALAIGGFIAWRLTERDAQAPAASLAAATTTAVVPPAPVSAERLRVDIELDADVPAAHVVYRRHVTPTPMKTQMLASDIVELVEISAPGYKAERFWLTFDRPTHLKAHLVKGTGADEATEEQTLIALGEAPAPADAAPVPRRPSAHVAVVAPRKIGRTAVADAPLKIEPATEPAAPEPPPVEPVAVVAPKPEPEKLVLPPPAPVPVPVPAPPAPKAELARAVVPPATLRALLASSTPIDAPESLPMEMARSNTKSAKTTVKVCIGTGGEVETVSMIKASGFASYDDRVLAGVRGWRYRPYVVGGNAVPACSAVVFAITAK